MTTSTQPAKPRLRLTPDGRRWLILTGFLWLVGVLKGIPLVILVSTCVLVTFAWNWFLVRRSLRGIQVKRWIGGPIFAQQPSVIAADLTNTGNRRRSGIRVEDAGPDHYMYWPIDTIEAKQSLRLRKMLTLPRRGAYSWRPVSALTRAPFGLVEAAIEGEAGPDIVVWPRLGTLHRGRLRRLLTEATASMDHMRLQSPALHPTAQGELHGVRSFRTGDSPRWIHWRTSARRGELMVREFEKTPADELILVVDPWIPSEPLASADAARTPSVNDQLEQILSMAATICWEWCRQKGERLVLGVAGKTPRVLDDVTSRKFAGELLDCLGLEEGTSDPDYLVLIERLGSMHLPTAPILLLSTRADSFQAELSARLNRRAAFVCAGDQESSEFFEGAVSYAH
jgi:uncharacterized protein (DUF58 family)